MSIRKTSNSSVYTWLRSTSGQNHLMSRFDYYGYHMSPGSNDGSVVATSKVKTPDWVDVEDGYDVEMFKLENRHILTEVSLMVATYRPRKTLSVGFVRIYFVDRSGRPFPQMAGVWNELLRPPCNGHVCGCVLDERGRLSGSFGIPDTPSIFAVARHMHAIYESWKHFPNESSFDMVKRLHEAIEDVKAMQEEEERKSYAGEIAKQRKQIQELQEDISKMEQIVNGIYEKAADAMNLLEEHGVDMNALDEIDELDAPIDSITLNAVEGDGDFAVSTLDNAFNSCVSSYWSAN